MLLQHAHEGMVTVWDDRKLPALRHALCDDKMRRILQEREDVLDALGLSAPLDVDHELLKYTAGKRCVIAYRLEDPAGSIQRVVGKIYRKDRGRRLFRQLRQLWECRTGATRSFCMAEPIAYVAPLGMILQRWVSGKTFYELNTEAKYRYSEEVGRNLAALHSARIPELQRRGMVQHISKYCRPSPGELASSLPELRGDLEHIVNAITDPGALADVPVCPVHGDLGLGQIFYDGTAASFLDLDGLCLSHAALDLANFSIALRLYGGPDGDALVETFLAAHRTELGGDEVPALRLYEALIYLRRATICFRLQSETDWSQRMSAHLESARRSLQLASVHSTYRGGFE